jgi:hypothetical protein
VPRQSFVVPRQQQINRHLGGGKMALTEIFSTLEPAAEAFGETESTAAATMTISRFMIGLNMVCRFGFVVRGFRMVVRWFGVMISRFMVGRFRRSSISFASLTMNSSSMVTSAQVLIENRAIAAVKSVLFAISMAKMINLEENKIN